MRVDQHSCEIAVPTLLFPRVHKVFPSVYQSPILAIVPMRMIEVQTGTYFGEDDIVRFDDEYGRT